jgi:hypothetical protein
MAERVHYYHAQASVLSGILERPVQQPIAPQASVSIPDKGGYYSERATGFRVEGVLSFGSGYTHVAGHMSRKPGHGWVTLATSVVENLNVMEVLTADRVVSQISTEHPLEGHVPTVTFIGSRFENLRIAGVQIEPVMDLNLCEGTAGKSGVFLINDAAFLKRVGEHYAQFASKNSPTWARERYHWNPGLVKSRGHVECSIVSGLKEKFPGAVKNVIDVPHFGRIVLGELLVDQLSFHLTMVRVEMGCIGHGSASMAIAMSNGRTFP